MAMRPVCALLRNRSAEPQGCRRRGATMHGRCHAARAFDPAFDMKSDPRGARSARRGARCTGLARALSKRGYCSRREAEGLIAAGRVQLDGKVERHPEAATVASSRIVVDGRDVQPARRVYLMLNKPRGLVTTVSDERGRATVYTCLQSGSLPWLAPVGRLDKASEGLLLFTNDTAWAAALLDPRSHVAKTYHVQIATVVDEPLMRRLEQGVRLRKDEVLGVERARLLRGGARNSWLEIVLLEGRNRHIRRLLEALDLEVLRLVRVAIGALELGDLPRGAWRFIDPAEVRAQ